VRSSPFSTKSVVLLDAGGTLITLDYERIRGVTARAGLRPADGDFDREEARARRWASGEAARGASAEDLWAGYFMRMLTGVGVEAVDAPRLIDRLWEVHREHGLWRRPIEGAVDACRKLLDRGWRLGVVSNAEGQVEADLNAAGFDGLFETVVDSHRVGCAKPHSRIFEIAFERMGIEADEALYVGDVPAFDVEGARAAGMPAVLIDSQRLYEDLDVPRIDSLIELPEILGNASRSTPESR